MTVATPFLASRPRSDRATRLSSPAAGPEPGRSTRRSASSTSCS